MKSDVFSSASESPTADHAPPPSHGLASRPAVESPDTSAPAWRNETTTPWRVRWGWFCRQWLPRLLFVVAAVFTVVLWQRHLGKITLPGEVEATGRFVVTYLQRDHRLRPGPGMTVQVRLCSDPRRVFAAQIEDVGAQVLAIPNHLLTKPSVPEWGRPVRIAVPPASGLKAGEQVDVMFARSSP
jgi:hypothetical protein